MLTTSKPSTRRHQTEATLAGHTDKQSYRAHSQANPSPGHADEPLRVATPRGERTGPPAPPGKGWIGQLAGLGAEPVELGLEPDPDASIMDVMSDRQRPARLEAPAEDGRRAPDEPAAGRAGIGSLAGQLDLNNDWDSAETNAEIAADFYDQD